MSVTNYGTVSEAGPTLNGEPIASNEKENLIVRVETVAQETLPKNTTTPRSCLGRVCLVAGIALGTIGLIAIPVLMAVLAKPNHGGICRPVFLNGSLIEPIVPGPIYLDWANGRKREVPWEEMTLEQQALTLANISIAARKPAGGHVCLNNFVDSQKYAYYKNITYFIPNATYDEINNLLAELKLLNEQTPQLIDNPTYVDVCNDLATAIKQSKTRSDAEEDFSLLIGEIKRGLKPFKTQSKQPFFHSLTEMLKPVLGTRPELERLAFAPPRDQVVALEKLYSEVVEELIRPRADHAALETIRLELGLYLPDMQYAAETGDETFDAVAQHLFAELYWWDPEGNAARRFKEAWETLQSRIRERHPSFTPERISDLVFCLKALVKRRNGAVDYWEEPIRNDMQSCLNLMG